MIVFQFGVIDLILSECVCFGFYHDTALTESKSTWDVIICLVMPSRVRFVCICFTLCSTSCVVFSLYSAMYVLTRIIKFSVFVFFFSFTFIVILFCPCNVAHLTFFYLDSIFFFFKQWLEKYFLMLLMVLCVFFDAVYGLICRSANKHDPLSHLTFTKVYFAIHVICFAAVLVCSLFLFLFWIPWCELFFLSFFPLHFFYSSFFFFFFLQMSILYIFLYFFLTHC